MDAHVQSQNMEADALEGVLCTQRAAIRELNVEIRQHDDATDILRSQLAVAQERYLPLAEELRSCNACIERGQSQLQTRERAMDELLKQLMDCESEIQQLRAFFRNELEQTHSLREQLLSTNAATLVLEGHVWA